MYAIGHTSLKLISLSNTATQNVIDRKAACKTKFKNAFYRAKIKNETWTFVEEYSEAKAIQALLMLDGAQG